MKKPKWEKAVTSDFSHFCLKIPQKSLILNIKATFLHIFELITIFTKNETFFENFQPLWKWMEWWDWCVWALKRCVEQSEGKEENIGLLLAFFPRDELWPPSCTQYAKISIFNVICFHSNFQMSLSALFTYLLSKLTNWRNTRPKVEGFEIWVDTRIFAHCATYCSTAGSNTAF